MFGLDSMCLPDGQLQLRQILGRGRKLNMLHNSLFVARQCSGWVEVRKNNGYMGAGPVPPSRPMGLSVGSPTFRFG